MEKIIKIIDGNQAVTEGVYKLTEIAAVYPITPSTPMGELYDKMSIKGIKNIYGSIPRVIEMQSEAGASGVMHGSLQSGCLATSFTSSQGLLLYIPNMYKIAGELTPNVIHVAARTIATHALSIFGDHSDVMCVRSTGYSIISSTNVQEAYDIAIISQLTTLETRIPMVHFFEGFRTSHEINKIETLSDEKIKSLVNFNAINEHRKRALTPDSPVLRGTAQDPDVFFQSREAASKLYKESFAKIKKIMEIYNNLTNKNYDIVEYYGDKNAERVIIAMGSAIEVIKETVDILNRSNEKVGVINIRLYRPFPKETFLNKLPKMVKKIAVLDRTKEPGSTGEPLFQDIVTTFTKRNSDEFTPLIIGGRYGLSSKEFTPAMCISVFNELNNKEPKKEFTIGINDDVMKTSLEYEYEADYEDSSITRAVFYGMGSDGTVSASKNTIKIIGENSNLFVQGYFLYGSKKSLSQTVSQVRISEKLIRKPYLIKSTNFIIINNYALIKYENIKNIVKNGTILINSSPYEPNEIWGKLSDNVKNEIILKEVSLFCINAEKITLAIGLGKKINTVMQTCFFKLLHLFSFDTYLENIKELIEKSYSSKGQEIVENNFKAITMAVDNLERLYYPHIINRENEIIKNNCLENIKTSEYFEKFAKEIEHGRGNELKVSEMPIDGTFPTGTSKWEKRNVSYVAAKWNKSSCIQCGKCSAVCPHSAIRVKKFCESELLKYGDDIPKTFETAKLLKKDNINCKMLYSLQVYVEDCTGCGLCHDVCPVKSKEAVKDSKQIIKAINLVDKKDIIDDERKNIKFFEGIEQQISENKDDEEINTYKLQYKEPLFEFPSACPGCGETSYIKIITQMFGDRMIVANATGCSSIYGGNLPTTPWTKNKFGYGPAWSNSLFEDNAEFGLGFRLSIDKLKDLGITLLSDIKNNIKNKEIISLIIKNANNKTTSGIDEQRKRISILKDELLLLNNEYSNKLLPIIDYLVYKSVWCIGGDGWAYDIGFGGLDHVLSTNEDVNILVLDTEVYSNTGGQASKSTPFGAIAEFATSGKKSFKKDLSMSVINYNNIFIAQISIGSNLQHTIKMLKKAEEHNGPSLIIAYSHCIAHGINMNLGYQLQKAAVDCGYWPLFHFDPKNYSENKQSFFIDSKKPEISFKEYAIKERRFSKIFKNDAVIANKVIENIDKQIQKKWSFYNALTKL